MTCFRARTLERAKKLRDKAIEIINHQPGFGAYVGFAPQSLPMVFVRFQTQEQFNEWYNWAKGDKNGQ